MIILDGDALFNRGAQNVLENFRFNPCGFGESKLAPLYDLLIRVTGTQQGAYHLVNLASVLVMSMKKLRHLNATTSPAKDKLEQIAEMISIYRGAIVDGEDVEFRQHSATFGSVPELVMSFLQILSAGSDIPATRFLGTAPGGLNATGQSDLENYYNMVGSWQRSHLLPIDRRLYDWLGASLWGWPEWKIKSRDLDIVYPPLWNQSALEKAQTENTVALMIKSLWEADILSTQSAIEELKQRELFVTDVTAGDFLARRGERAENPLGDGFETDAREYPGTARAENSRVYLLNAGFKESDHTRDGDGKFSTSGGGDGGEPTAGKKDITEVLGREHTGVKGQAAVDTLLAEKGGHVKDAFHRDDIGGIGLVWGNDEFGLQHIIKQRTERDKIDAAAFLSNIAEVIENGALRKSSDGNPFVNKNGSYEILLDGKMAAVTPALSKNKGMQYLVTAFRTRKKSHLGD